MALNKLGALFFESMKAAGLRQMAAVAVHEELSARLTWCAVDTWLHDATLQVRLRLWWPWWALLGLAHVVSWWLARRTIFEALLQLQVPMRAVRVRVGSIKKKPRRR